VSTHPLYATTTAIVATVFSLRPGAILHNQQPQLVLDSFLKQTKNNPRILLQQQQQQQQKVDHFCCYTIRFCKMWLRRLGDRSACMICGWNIIHPWTIYFDPS
jgi:hypothetical protein